jgi:hypothetical protein
MVKLSATSMLDKSVGAAPTGCILIKGKCHNMKYIKMVLLAIILFALLFAAFPKDTNRHPITGVLHDKYEDKFGVYHFVVACDGFTQDVREVPYEVYRAYHEGERITVMIRGSQYRYMGDTR